MFRLLVLKYAPKLVKAKKTASYMLQKEKAPEDELPLLEAIKKKSDPNLMEDAYNPTAVQKHWHAWWQ